MVVRVGGVGGGQRRGHLYAPASSRHLLRTSFQGESHSTPPLPGRGAWVEMVVWLHLFVQPRCKQNA